MMRRSLLLIAALLVLNASLSFANIWPTPAIAWQGELSIEFAVLLLLAAAIPLRPLRSAAVLRGVTVAWMLLVFGRYAEVTAPALYGRDVNLYWDLRFVPDVVAMGTRVMPAWLVAVTCGAVVLTLAAMYLVLRSAIGVVASALDHRRTRVALLLLAIASSGWFVAQSRLHGADTPRFAAAITPGYLRQLRFAVHAFRGDDAVAPSPPIDADLRAVSGADVLLVFMEAYGATSYDRPEFAGPFGNARQRLLEAARSTGRDAVSALVESPTFGGSSWLAHLTLLSGVEVRDPDTNAQLMAQHRDTLVRLFRRRGYRTVALMPGLKQTWPDGAFYGFDQIYGAGQLAYQGPEFGWFAVPDQFSLERLRTLELDRPSRAPLFVFFPFISSHFPFSPTPPYQPDWSKMQGREPYDAMAITTAYSDQPDWIDFGPGYVRAMSYEFASLGGFLQVEAGRDLVLVLVGDHQPAAAVSGAGARWDVPVHVVASRRAVLDRLVSLGFTRGMTPQQRALGPMSRLLPLLLDAFSARIDR
jgi:hypothetical protein